MSDAIEKKTVECGFEAVLLLLSLQLTHSTNSLQIAIYH